MVLCILKPVSKCIKFYFFSRKKKLKKYTLPKIFRPVTRNTLILLFGLISYEHEILCPGHNFIKIPQDFVTNYIVTLMSRKPMGESGHIDSPEPSLLA